VKATVKMLMPNMLLKWRHEQVTAAGAVAAVTAKCVCGLVLVRGVVGVHLCLYSHVCARWVGVDRASDSSAVVLLGPASSVLGC